MGNNYNNTDDINNIELNLFENNKEENKIINNKKIKYVESKENDILILGLNNEKNNLIDENNVNENNVNVIKEINIKFNDINDNLIINNTKDTSKIKENIAQNVDNFNIEDKSEDNKINNFLENNNHNNSIEDNNIEENNLLKSVIKKYRSYSFNSNNDRKKKEINISENNKSRDDNDIIKESSNKIPKIYDIYKNEEFSINKNDNDNNIKKNQFDNLIENNQNLFIANAKEKINKVENVKNNFELEILSDKRNKLNEPKELIIENKFFLIKNEDQNIKKEIPFEINNKLEVEYKKENININDIYNVINTENEDSEIIPIEQDNNKITIFEKSPKDNKINNNQICSNNNFFIKNTYSSNNESRLKSKNNNFNNNNNSYDSEREFSDDLSNDLIDINVPKSGKYNLLQKINELFPKKFININEDIKENNININNYKINKPNYYIINSNINALRAKSENKQYKNKKEKDHIPKHIKEIYKLYKTKSANTIESKYQKTKNVEYLRALQDKFDFE